MRYKGGSREIRGNAWGRLASFQGVGVERWRISSPLNFTLPRAERKAGRLTYLSDTTVRWVFSSVKEMEMCYRPPYAYYSINYKPMQLKGFGRSRRYQAATG